MRVISCALLALLAVAAVSLPSAHADGDQVNVLTEANFDEFIGQSKATLVEFFAPWCGHCKALAPEYAKAAELLQGKDAGALASVDCTEHRELCNKYEVRGFPTLKLFRNDGSEPSDYDAARKSDAIVSWMIKQSLPAVSDVQDISAFAEGDAVKIIAFIAEDATYTQFEKVANAMRNEYSFGVVKGAAAAESNGATVGTVRVYRTFDEGNVDFQGASIDADTFAEELTVFIKGAAFPLVGEIGPENYQKYLERGFNFVWVFVDPAEDAHKELLKNVIAPVAKNNRNALSFVQLDGIKWAEHAKSFGLSGGVPGIVIEDREKGKKYVFDEDKEVTAGAFAEFITAYNEGTLVAKVKSEPEPETQDGPVYVLVGSSFERVVLDKSKDVLVEFYAPWCGHCKSLAPKYDELGEMFANNANVVIAKVDATANDTPAQIQGFPTLILYTAVDNEEIPFEGDRTAEAMGAFIKENGKATAAATDAAATKEEL